MKVDKEFVSLMHSMKITRQFSRLVQLIINDDVMIVSTIKQDKLDNNYVELIFPEDYSLVTERGAKHLPIWYMMEQKESNKILIWTSLDGMKIADNNVQTISQVYATITTIEKVRHYKSYKKYLAV